MEQITNIKKVNRFITFVFWINSFISVLSVGWYVSTIIWRGVLPHAVDIIVAIAAVIFTIAHATLMYLAWSKGFKTKELKMIQIFKTKVDANGQTITRKTKPIYFYLFFSMLCYVACIVLNIINAATPDSNPWPAIVLIVLTVINFIILFFAKRAHKATKQIVKQMGA